MRGSCGLGKSGEMVQETAPILDAVQAKSIYTKD
jgi:hypothetical protein